MNRRHPWVDLLFGQVSLATSTVVLAVFGALGGDKGWRIWIIGIVAGFVVLHAFVNASRERDIFRRLGREYDRVQRRGVQVVADLGELAGRQFDLWMVDLYLHRPRWCVKKDWPLLRRESVLERALAVSLIDVRPQPPLVEESSGPLWRTFVDGSTLNWFNKSLYRSDFDNSWNTLDEATNILLAEAYGVLTTCPLVDHLHKDCLGVLAVHVKPENDTIHKALVTLNTDQARRRLNEACVELHGLLSR